MSFFPYNIIITFNHRIHSFPQTRVLFFIDFEDIRIVMTREYEDSMSFVATLSIPNSTLNANVFIDNMQMNRQSYVQ